MTRSAARSVADLDTGTVLATVDIAAPPERVFRALTEPDEVLRWWGSDTTYRITAWQADVRPGGRWRSVGRDARGGSFSVGGAFVTVEAPRLLVYTWEPSWHPGKPTTVTIRLTPEGGGTRVTLRHDGFAPGHEQCRSHADGWALVLGWLVAHAAPRPEAAFFVSRLLAPRPTFPADITAEERELMMSHAGYWSKLLAEGRAVVFGPVGDPKGVWGLGVLRVADEAEARAIVDADPAILAGRGFGVELLPMISGHARD